MRPPASDGPLPEPLWSIDYHDGNGNGFRFQKVDQDSPATFHYIPVEPAQSSSGTYCGGESREGEVEPSAAEEMWRIARDLEEATHLHANSRMMGTGFFMLRDNSGERGFILNSGPALATFDEFVSRFRGGASYRGRR